MIGFFKAWKAKRRRERYDFLKREISKRHFEGYGGLVVNFKRKFDVVDMLAFRPPMYSFQKNRDGKWVIAWDRARLAQEIGTGLPLREGEVILDHPGRTRPDTTLETIDVQKPLTQVTTNG